MEYRRPDHNSLMPKMSTLSLKYFLYIPHHTFIRNIFTCMALCYHTCEAMVFTSVWKMYSIISFYVCEKNVIQTLDQSPCPLLIVDILKPLLYHVITTCMSHADWLTINMAFKLKYGNHKNYRKLGYT